MRGGIYHGGDGLAHLRVLRPTWRLFCNVSRFRKLCYHNLSKYEPFLRTTSGPSVVVMRALEASSDRSPEITGERTGDKMTVVERFSPAGLKVLVVDDDPVCLMILETMLRQCNYTVTTCQRASKALSLLRENKSAFDLVMSDVYMPDMDGFKLLEAIGLELDLPVIMMSANGETDVVMKGITHGACDYLLKPVRIEELRNIWQHVIRRRGRGESVKDDQSGDWDETGRGLDSPSEGDTNSRKRKEKQEPADEPLEDVNSLKKARVVWSVELHQQFVNAVNQLGIDKAVPKRILEIMNVQGLSRENVASHLQKYRQYLKRLSGVSTQPYPVASFQAAQPGNFGGSMQIQPGGRGVAAASCGKGMTVPVAGSNTGGLRRGLAQIDSATLSTLAQLQAHQQSQAGLISSQMLGGLNQLNVGVRPSLANPTPNVSFPGLQRMSSLELDMLMKAAQQDSISRQQSGTITGDDVVGLGGQQGNFPPLPIGLSSFKREDDLGSLQGVGFTQVFGTEKCGVELGSTSPFGAINKRGLQDRVSESSYNIGFSDYGAAETFVPTSPSDISVSLLSQVFPHQSTEDYQSEQ